MHANSIDQFLGVEYRKLDQRSCYLSYGIRPGATLAAAKEICTYDRRCIGVLDLGCDGGIFHLCDAAYPDYFRTPFDCVYDKEGKS